MRLVKAEGGKLTIEMSASDAQFVGLALFEFVDQFSSSKPYKVECRKALALRKLLDKGIPQSQPIPVDPWRLKK